MNQAILFSTKSRNNDESNFPTARLQILAFCFNSGDGSCIGNHVSIQVFEKGHLFRLTGKCQRSSRVLS